jgi:hypothetical protein
MKKIALSDGRWFDAESAKEFKAASYLHNSGEEVCMTTGLPFLWDTLYLTENSNFVLVRTCDQYAPDAEGAHEIDWAEAAKWLIQNGHQDKLKELEMQYEERQLEL